MAYIEALFDSEVQSGRVTAEAEIAILHVPEQGIDGDAVSLDAETLVLVQMAPAVEG